MAAAVVLLGVTLVQLRLWWKHQHARTLFIFQKEPTAPFFLFFSSLFLSFLHLHIPEHFQTSFLKHAGKHFTILNVLVTLNLDS